MNRALARVVASSMVVASLSVLVVQPAAARPRSWFLPSLDVACESGQGAGTFVGNMDLGTVEMFKGQLTVGGALAGSCGSEASLDTLFRTTIKVVESDCDEAQLRLGDLEVRDTQIALSEDPIVISAGAAKYLRGALCALDAAEGRSNKALIRTLNRVLSLQG